MGRDMPARKDDLDSYAGGYGQASGGSKGNGQLNHRNGFSIHHGTFLEWSWPRFQGFSIEDEVRRHYFPDAYGFRLFGDPYENKRRYEQNKHT